MQDYTTRFASLADHQGGWLQVIDGEARHYAFSNVFAVAAQSRPYEKVVVALNLDYVLEALRAEGQSPWYAAAHDEFAIAMDGEVDVEFVKLDEPGLVDAGQRGAVIVGQEQPPAGRRMGVVHLKRGHQTLMAPGSAYRFTARCPGVLVLQTTRGELSVEKWADICER